ncbi:MAG: glycosyltransferase [Fusobacteriaceae bacterium]
MKKKISVCIATYNGEKYIEEQLLSIINQNLKVDEIIISDVRHVS